MLARLFEWLQRQLNIRNVILLTLVPFAGAAIFIGLAALNRLPVMRYDPDLFTDSYTTRYNAPSMVVIDLERALRTGDGDLMRELQGLRRPQRLTTSDNVRMTVLYDVTDQYVSYLFWDTRTYDRFPYHLEQVNGRWVVAPEDTAFYLNTGLWRSTWLPLAALWWIIEATLLIVLGLNRLMGKWQQETFAV